MSKLFSPKAWYLVGVGALALTADGVRRIVKRRRRTVETIGEVPPVDVAETPGAATKAKPAKTKKKAAKPKEAEAVSHPGNGEVMAKPPVVPVKAEPVAITPVAAEVPASAASPLIETLPDGNGQTMAVDLTQIKGIGPTYARRLAEAGFVSYGDIANASADRLREMTKAPPMTDIEAWIAQARRLGG